MTRLWLIYFKAPSQHSTEWTKENHEKSQDSW